jgi:hypothetical protein
VRRCQGAGGVNAGCLLESEEDTGHKGAKGAKFGVRWSPRRTWRGRRNVLELHQRGPVDGGEGGAARGVVGIEELGELWVTCRNYTNYVKELHQGGAEPGSWAVG